MRRAWVESRRGGQQVLWRRSTLSERGVGEREVETWVGRAAVRRVGQAFGFERERETTVVGHSPALE
ncbi:hypothetical protein [Haladaptatus halobius]|uniref:hypothetical protein n=1 Tax=Haladaptatus halobius TaxID=2884875 RepID=UPI001D0B02FF|nr:hypothetical protein [Haladaptatus halobius]